MVFDLIQETFSPEFKRKIESKGFDLAIHTMMLHQRIRPELISIPNHLVNTKLDLYKRHEVCYNLDLAQALGWQGEIPDTYLYISRDNYRYKIPKTSIGVCMGVSDSNKRWPVENWAELINVLSEDYPIVFVGGGNGVGEVEKIKPLLKKEVIDFVGKTTIKETAAIIEQCLVFISIDCGPMHIATAVKTPVVSLFGPTIPSKSRPWGNPEINKVVKSHLDCSPCYATKRAKYCNHFRCMSEIKVEVVLEVLSRVLSNLKKRPIDEDPSWKREMYNIESGNEVRFIRIKLP
jgi:ADP-heptose:LPS heptosyltransferase